MEIVQSSSTLVLLVCCTRSFFKDCAILALPREQRMHITLRYMALLPLDCSTFAVLHVAVALDDLGSYRLCPFLRPH